jgi:serine/threonine protein kinase
VSFAFLQAGVVHRDLKPANVLFRSETGRETGRRDALKVASPRGIARP